jgi:hypothetical protein
MIAPVVANSSKTSRVNPFDCDEDPPIVIESGLMRFEGVVIEAAVELSAIPTAKNLP